MTLILSDSSNQNEATFLRKLIDMESYYCVDWNDKATARQEALLCESCEKWQVRRRNTGITRQQCRDAVKCGFEVVCHCMFCNCNCSICREQQNRERNECLVIHPPSFEITQSQDIGMSFFILLNELTLWRICDSVRSIDLFLTFLLDLKLRVLVPVAFIIASAMNGYDNNFC